jgi:ADP-ribose pyrophosphatase YjhB (NUDIX family)
VEPIWLEWARRLNALAQTGLTFATGPYDIERYTAIRAIAAEMIAQGAGADTSRVLDLLASDAGYATPKVDVRGAVFRDGKILLVQERSDGLWTLPGGWADVGDSPAEAVVREVREESGFEARATKLLALLDRNRHGHSPHVNHIYKVFIRCEILGGSPTTCHEIQAVGFLREDEIPALSLTRIVPLGIPGDVRLGKDDEFGPVLDRIRRESGELLKRPASVEMDGSRRHDDPDPNRTSPLGVCDG